MTRSDYEHWVNYATNNYIKIPARLVFNYLNWRHRSRLGRYLLRAGELDAAIRVLRSVINIKVPLYKDDGGILSPIEDRVWCLQDLAVAVWTKENNGIKALKYLDEALKLATVYSYKFYFVNRGFLWRDKLEILKSVGRIAEAKSEAVDKIRTLTPLYGKSNSFVFNAYDFLASLAYQKDRINAALWFMREALRYFPGDLTKNSKVQEIWNHHSSNPSNAYEKLKEFTYEDDLIWDDDGKEPPNISGEHELSCLISWREESKKLKLNEREGRVYRYRRKLKS